MRPFVFCLCLLPACAPFPDLDDAGAQQAAQGPYPSLVPIETILAARPTSTAPATADLDGRVAALKARAARLRGPVIDAATRTRMTRGVAL